MKLLDALDPTWPSLEVFSQGPFTLRNGAGGGKRVSAATLETEALPDEPALAQAEATMREMGQTPLFSLRPEQTAFDRMLDARGYARVDATRMYHIPANSFDAIEIPRVTAFTVWEPLAIMEDIWAEGGIGPARLDVMHRAKGPKTGVLGRIHDTPGGAGFVALHNNIAMLHALETRKALRRNGLARWMVIAAAQWASAQGATTLALLVTEANDPANALYRAMGFEPAPGYHYRVLEETHT